MSSKILQFMR